MTINYPGPFEIRLFYTTTPSGKPAYQHQAKYNCLMDGTPTPGGAFSGMNILTRSGLTAVLSTAIDAWVTLIKPGFSNTGGNTIDFAELWEYEPNSFNASFISSYSIAVAGTGVANPVAGSEVIITYRTGGGGVMKQYFMESITGHGDTDSPPFASATWEGVRNFTIGTTNWQIGRDGNWPFTAINLYPGQSEKLFKLRYRA